MEAKVTWDSSTWSCHIVDMPFEPRNAVSLGGKRHIVLHMLASIQAWGSKCNEAATSIFSVSISLPDLSSDLFQIVCQTFCISCQASKVQLLALCDLTLEPCYPGFLLKRCLHSALFCSTTWDASNNNCFIFNMVKLVGWCRMGNTGKDSECMQGTIRLWTRR